MPTEMEFLKYTNRKGNIHIDIPFILANFQVVYSLPVKCETIIIPFITNCYTACYIHNL